MDSPYEVLCSAASKVFKLTLTKYIYFFEDLSSSAQIAIQLIKHLDSIHNQLTLSAWKVSDEEIRGKCLWRKTLEKICNLFGIQLWGCFGQAENKFVFDSISYGRPPAELLTQNQYSWRPHRSKQSKCNSVRTIASKVHLRPTSPTFRFAAVPVAKYCDRLRSCSRHRLRASHISETCRNKLMNVIVKQDEEQTAVGAHLSFWVANVVQASTPANVQPRPRKLFIITSPKRSTMFT